MSDPTVALGRSLIGHRWRPFGHVCGGDHSSFYGERCCAYISTAGCEALGKAVRRTPRWHPHNYCCGTSAARSGGAAEQDSLVWRVF